MYQVTIKGRNLDELKKAVSDINNELNNGTVLVRGIEKDMSTPVEVYKPLTVEEVKSIPTEVSNPIVTEAVQAVQENIVAPVMTAPVTEGEPDSKGVRWDGRIHNKMKTKTVKGTFKLIKGGDKELAVKLIAEQLATAPMQVVSQGPITVATEPLVDNLEPEVGSLLDIAGPDSNLTKNFNSTTVIEAPVTPSMNGGHTVDTFTANFAMVIGSLISEGKVTQDYIETLKGHFGVIEIWQISNEQKAEVFAGFVQGGIIQQVG